MGQDAMSELTILRKIHRIYVEILNTLDFDYYMTREAELDQLFSKVYDMKKDDAISVERKQLIQSIYQLNQKLSVFVLNEKNKLENQNKMLSNYSPTYGSVFFDKKG